MTKFLRCSPLAILILLTACGRGGGGNSANSSGKTAATLQSIQVAAANASVPMGATEQLTATGSYSDGSNRNLTDTVAWTVSNSAILSVSSTGLASAETHGSATITATLGSVSGTTTLTITGSSLTSITVQAAAAAVAPGGTDQFTAIGNYSNGSTQALTSVTWSSSNQSVATISASGLATAKVQGATVITATMGTVSGAANLTVGTASLTSITVNSSSASVGVGSTDQFTATGNYSDGSTLTLTNSVTWGSSNTGLATVSNAGLVTGKAAGSVTITATSGPITGSANLTVTASLVSLSVTPALPTVAPNTTQQFHATGTFSDGSIQDVTSTVTWSSATPTVATISNSLPNNGLATAVKAGTSVITAYSGSASSSTTLTVSSATLSSIAITPSISTIPLDVVEQFTATATFSDGSTQNITNTATWSVSSSSSPAPVSITASGAATATSTGTATITAKSGTITGSIQVTVSTANLVSITIQQGSNVTIAQQTSTKLNAIGLFTDGSTHDISALVTWTSGNQPCATVISTGRVTGIVPGQCQATVTASFGSPSITASTTVNVTNATLASVSVTPSNPTVAPGTQLSFAATGVFSDLSTQVITYDVTWATSDNTIATINNATGGHGIASALFPGGNAATISATLEGITGTATLNVSSASVSKITLTSPSGVLAPASTLQFTAVASFNDNSSQNVSTSATWTVTYVGSTPIATITSYGQVTGQSPGMATVTATLGGVSNSANILVESYGALNQIVVTPAALTVPAQIIGSLNATGYFGSSNPPTTQNLTTVVTWTSSNAAVATVSNTGGTATPGEVTGIAPGNSTIAASFGGQVGTATVQVPTNVTLTGLAITPASPTINLGASEALVATATFSDLSTMNVTSQATWTSSDITVAVVSPMGVVTSAGTGTTTITATVNGVSTTTGVTVQ